VIEHVWMDNGIVRWHIGTVSAAQILVSDREIRTDSRLAQARFIIDDFRDCKALLDADLLSAEQFTGHAAHIAQPGEFRHALVASLPSVKSLGDRLIATGQLAYPVMRFTDMCKAKEWAGVNKCEQQVAPFSQWPPVHSPTKVSRRARPRAAALPSLQP